MKFQYFVAWLRRWQQEDGTINVDIGNSVIHRDTPIALPDDISAMQKSIAEANGGVGEVIVLQWQEMPHIVLAGKNRRRRRKKKKSTQQTEVQSASQIDTQSKPE